MSLDSSLIKLATAVAKLTNLSVIETCTEPGCNKQVSKPGHKLCYECWKKNNAPQVSKPQPPQPSKPQPQTSTQLLSATKLGEKLAIHKNKVNSIFAELGLLNKEGNGWIATKLGIGFGAVQKKDSQTKVSFVMWPESILTNQAFIKTIESIKGDTPETSAKDATSEQKFREKFRANAQHRTTDGHWVRSKAEVLIDNWLYMAGVVHAYERRLPIEEELYCDFYVPAGKVYIEYWGYENDQEYTRRKKVKQELYQKYNFNLIELSDEHIKNLDDCLPKMLLKFGVLIS